MRGGAASALRIAPLVVPLLAAAQSLPPLGQAPWRVAGLPDQKPPLTRYAIETVDGRTALRVDANASYGNYVLDLPGAAPPRRVAWSWRIDRANEAADLRRKQGDDTAARVCLSFELPIERVPFVERQMLRMARGVSGQPLPAATLCWVWGRDEPRAQPIDNPYSRRVRYLVLRGAADGSGRWLDESRDVAADWRLAFGDEAAGPPPLAALIVAGDADNTGAHSVAHVVALRFEP